MKTDLFLISMSALYLVACDNQMDGDVKYLAPAEIPAELIEKANNQKIETVEVKPLKKTELRETVACFQTIRRDIYKIVLTDQNRSFEIFKNGAPFLSSAQLTAEQKKQLEPMMPQLVEGVETISSTMDQLDEIEPRDRIYGSRLNRTKNPLAVARLEVRLEKAQEQLAEHIMSMKRMVHGEPQEVHRNYDDRVIEARNVTRQALPCSTMNERQNS